MSASSKVCSYEITFLRLHDGSSMALWEWSLFIEELILRDGG